MSSLYYNQRCQVPFCESSRGAILWSLRSSRLREFERETAANDLCRKYFALPPRGEATLSMETEPLVLSTLYSGM